MMDENDLGVQRAIVDARHAALRADTTPAETFTRSLPVLSALEKWERAPAWQLALWWVGYLTVLAFASWLSTLAWHWSPFAGGAAWGTTVQLAFLPWRR